MVATPLPDPAPPSEGGEVVPIDGGGGGAPVATDLDGWTTLETMRRRIDDQGTVVRKTAAQVGELAHSIAALVEDGRRKQRRVNLNSFVAYAIFTLLMGGGFYALYRARASDLDGRPREPVAATAPAAATKAETEAVAKLAAREAADAAAWDAYQLLESGKRADAKDKLAALRDAPLSKIERAVLFATAHDAEVKAGDGAVKAAVAAFKAGKPADAIAPLEAALATEPPGTRGALMKYYLGVAYGKGSEVDKSIKMLDAAIAENVEQEDAHFQLASVLDKAGQYPRARAEYDKFATAHPQLTAAGYAMRRSATLAKLISPPPAVAPVVPPKAAAPPPPPPPATPPPADDDGALPH